MNKSTIMKQEEYLQEGKLQVFLIEHNPSPGLE